MPAVEGFRVKGCDTFKTHQAVQIKLSIAGVGAKVEQAKKTPSAAKAIEELIADGDEDRTDKEKMEHMQISSTE